MIFFVVNIFCLPHKEAPEITIGVTDTQTFSTLIAKCHKHNIPHHVFS